MCGISFTISRKDVENVIENFKENVLRRGPDASIVEIIQVRSVG